MHHAAVVVRAIIFQSPPVGKIFPGSTRDFPQIAKIAE
jgi:hypothetical protein